MGECINLIPGADLKRGRLSKVKTLIKRKTLLSKSQVPENLNSRHLFKFLINYLLERKIAHLNNQPLNQILTRLREVTLLMGVLNL